MYFEILGPLQVRRDGRPVVLAAAKQRALLAILLVHANEVLSSDRLIEELWTAPPETADNALQVYVGKLRKALEPERARAAPAQLLITRPPGYTLRLDPDQLDAARFERLLAAGSEARQMNDNAAAAETLRVALDLWQGPPLADFTYEPFAQGEIARLEELHIVALEERIAADLALGRHPALVGELEALTREHPLRERLRERLMLALYRSGRQADALDVYRETRRTLLDELGIDPSPELQSLEASILRQDPRLELSSEATIAAREAPTPAIVRDTPAEGRRKTVTVLVAGQAGVRGLDPEALSGEDERLRDLLSKAVERYGGRLERALGDETMAVFGVPLVHEDDSLRAARAAIDFRNELAATDGAGRLGTYDVRIGIAAGEVLAREPTNGESSVVGEPVTLARQLENLAAPGEILLLAEGGPPGLRTESVKTDVGTAERVLGFVSEQRLGLRTLQTPITGREEELDRLEGAFDRAVRERAVHLLTVLGPAGIGKTRLVQEFASRLDGGATVLAGRCAPYGEGITFSPLGQIIRQLTDADPVTDSMRINRRARAVTERLAEAIGDSGSSASREEIFWATRELLEALALSRPVVVLFEDAQWAEPTFLELIEYLTGRARGAPILLVCLARPELLDERPAWGERPNASSLVLGPLPEPACDALIENVALGLEEEVRARVREAGAGNPLFLEQILVALAEQGPKDGEVPIPATIQALLSSRLDRLGPGERAVIELAAAIGGTFSDAAVVDLLPAEARSVGPRHLEALIRKELIRSAAAPGPGQEEFLFRHSLIQQSAYRAIPKRQRAKLHERIADRLEGDESAGTSERAELVGYHLERAVGYRAELAPPSDADRDLASRAARHLGSAGRLAFSRGDMPASVNLLERAARLSSSDPSGGLELLPELGCALFEVGELERAEAVLGDARKRARASGDRAVEWRAAVKGSQIRLYRHPEQIDAQELATEAGEAIDVLDGLGDEAGLARAWGFLSELRWMVGQVGDAADAARRSAEHAHRAGSPREEAAAYGTWGFCILQGPTPVAEGVAWLEALLDTAGDDAVMEATMSPFLAVHEAMLGRFDDARARIAAARALTTDLGLRWQSAKHTLLSVDVESLAGDAGAAERALRTAKEAFGEIRDDWCMSTLAVWLPQIIYAQGRHDAFEAEADEIRLAPTAPADLEWQVGRRIVRAKLLLGEGETEAAETLTREAVALASETDMLGLHAGALLDLAEILEAGGRPDEAAAAASEAGRLYERKGNEVYAHSTREFAAALEGRRPTVPT